MKYIKNFKIFESKDNTDIKTIARKMGLRTVKVNKKDVIRQIQLNEGNFPCFNTGIKDCMQFNCSWRDDCIK